MVGINQDFLNISSIHDHIFYNVQSTLYGNFKSYDDD